MTIPTVEIKPLEAFRPQAENANLHTARGEAMLRDSIQRDGWIDAETVAADGEHISGSSRYEQALATGFEDAIVIHSDGTKPIIVVRDDIPTARHPRAKRLGVAANRAPQENLHWSGERLAALQAEDDAILAGLFRDDELAALLPVATVEPGGGGDEFDTTPAEGPTRCQVGDVWAIGAHRLAVGDSTDPATVARLLDGQRAAICFTSPPYNAGDSERLSGNTHTTTTKYVQGSSDDLNSGEYLSLLGGFTAAALQHAQFVFVNIQVLAGNKVALLEYQYAYRHHFADVLIWDKTHAAPQQARRVVNSQFEYILCFSAEENPTRAIGTHEFRGTVPNVYQGGPQRNNEFAEVHAATFPLHLPTWVLETFTNRGEPVLDPFLGTGTTLIAAHRTGRICYGCELSPQYADVILRRAEAEGIGPIERLTANQDCNAR